jgi:hypothetical protein
VKKIDLYQLHKSEYAAPKKPVLLECLPAQYLAVKGSGEPGGEAFQAAIRTLYKTAFTIKMASKFAGRDYAVCKLEGIWRAKNDWTLIIRTPDFITKTDVPLIRLDEGRAIQLLHVGPYDRITESVARMQEFAASEKLRFKGAHHEIYLSDPRRVEPARLRTILRQPVK